MLRFVLLAGLAYAGFIAFANVSAECREMSAFAWSRVKVRKPHQSPSRCRCRTNSADGGGAESFDKFRAAIMSGEKLSAGPSEQDMQKELLQALGRLLPGVNLEDEGFFKDQGRFSKKLRRATDNTTYSLGLTEGASSQIREACRKVLGSCHIRIHGSHKKRTCSNQGLSDLDLDVMRTKSNPRVLKNVTYAEKVSIREELRKIPWVCGPEGVGCPVVTAEVAIKLRVVEENYSLNVDLVPKPQHNIRREDFSCMLGTEDRAANEYFLQLFYRTKHSATFQAIRALKLLLPGKRPQGVLLEVMVARVCCYYGYAQGPQDQRHEHLWSALVVLRTLEELAAWNQSRVFGKEMITDLALMKNRSNRSNRSAQRADETRERLISAMLDIQNKVWFERWKANYTAHNTSLYGGQVLRTIARRSRRQFDPLAIRKLRRENMLKNRHERLAATGNLLFGATKYYRDRKRPNWPIECLLSGNDTRKLNVLYHQVLAKGNLKDDLQYHVQEEHSGMFSATILMSDLRQPTRGLTIKIIGDREENRKAAKRNATEKALRYWKERWFDDQ